MKIEFMSGGFGTKLVWLPANAEPILEAASAARQVDVVIAVVGITSKLEGEEMKVDLPGFIGGDRTSLNLPEEEEALLGALKGTGKPLVVVLMNGSALAVNWANDHANAILDAWYSGEEGGTAVAETLAGANNPSGRLPVTFYKGVEQLPDFDDYAMKHRTYRYFTGQPLYPFGFGLTYSTFLYSDLKLSSNDLHAGDPLAIDVDVKNTSQRAGDEVVELFLNFPEATGRASSSAPRLYPHPSRCRRVTPREARTATSRFELCERSRRPAHFLWRLRRNSLVEDNQVQQPRTWNRDFRSTASNNCRNRISETCLL